jgi:predicted RNA-binding protein with PUA-like domain
MPRSLGFWLVKTEPECFSIHDLAASPRQTTCWSGVRNFQARNYLRDGMKMGDQVLFYHSNADPPAIVGLAVVVREAYPDFTAWDAADDHYDPKATPENPIWQMVDIQFKEAFPHPLGLAELRHVAGLKKMELLRKGSRLSVQPVSAAEFEIVLQLAHAPADDSRPERRAASAKRGAAVKPPTAGANLAARAAKSSTGKRPSSSRR